MTTDPPEERDLSAMQHFCVYCWPRLTRATFWDSEGWACCPECGLNGNRERRMPAYHHGHLDGWSRAA